MAKNKKSDSKELAQALQIARLAGTLTLDWFQQTNLSIQQKQDGSPVTDADKAAEELIRQEIGRRWPEDQVIGEEFSSSEKIEDNASRVWTIDPIDGTRSFVCGVPLYTTLLALRDEAGWKLGVIYAPALNEMVYGARGEGAFLVNPQGETQRLQVSSISDMSRARLVSSGLEYLPKGLKIMDGSTGMFRTWGDGYGYMLVASGRADIMLDSQLHIWDIAPMLTIIPEAGGEVVSWQGEKNPLQGDVVTTNGHLTQAALKVL